MKEIDMTSSNKKGNKFSLKKMQQYVKTYAQNCRFAYLSMFTF
jgi:hypothetical protein